MPEEGRCGTAPSLGMCDEAGPDARGGVVFPVALVTAFDARSPVPPFRCGARGTSLTSAEAIERRTVSQKRARDDTEHPESPAGVSSLRITKPARRGDMAGPWWHTGPPRAAPPATPRVTEVSPHELVAGAQYRCDGLGIR